MSENIDVDHEIVQASIKKMDGLVGDLSEGVKRIQSAVPLGTPPATVALFQAELKRMLNVSWRALEDTQLQMAGLAQTTYAVAAEYKKVEDETKTSLMNIEQRALEIDTSRNGPTPTTSPRVDTPAAVPGTSTGIR